MAAVRIKREPLILPTYRPLPADRNPMFLEKRVYQGSSGKIYPLPFTDRIAAQKEDQAWDAVTLENDFIRVVMLPEIGGRIHSGRDKTNGYDFFYEQNVIKPALVGLAGPWISGGVEFNWPQHHRPATYLPADVHIEQHKDGAVTVWLSDHDPLTRMKGMHGICLHPDKAILEIKVRAYNRTAEVQTFLWWANAAIRVHERYQSFFPPDVYYVADHAKRAMSTFPLCADRYYGVKYGERARRGVPGNETPGQFLPLSGRYAPNDLSWYANIPVPTSYMCMGTKENFFGGYDHARQAGVVHVANPHIAPGKKQWTWGNHAFGYAWDRNLTEADERGEYGPYIELMAGVYTDNQPDFSFLMPGETKTWSQYWYPIQQIGPVQKANQEAAISLRTDRKRVRVGVAVTERLEKATVRLRVNGKATAEWIRNLAPDAPLVEEVTVRGKTKENELRVEVIHPDGRMLLSYAPATPVRGKIPSAATEPPLPAAVKSNDELYVTGLHLEQYRHATRAPEPYWREALRRDPGDSRCHLALGKWHRKRGEWEAAETHLRHAVERLTLRNPNPYDGEAHYQLGLVLRQLNRLEEAYAAFYKATWNQAWQATGYHALAELDCRRGNWAAAREHLDRALRMNTDNLRARNLRVLVLRQLKKTEEAETQLRANRALDPLDWWARDLAKEALACTTQVRLDLALDYAAAGFFAEATAILLEAKPESGAGMAPLVHYYLGWLYQRQGDMTEARKQRVRAARASPDYCFPARLEEIEILEGAMAANAKDARAPYYLGNLLYDKGRHPEAIRHWERAARIDKKFSVAWRNLGIGYYNVAKQPHKARAAYDRAFAAAPDDARVLYERDQLWKRLRVPPKKRLAVLEKHLPLVQYRDDLTVELCALLNQTGRHPEARQLLRARAFQPWEGGEGLALGQHGRTQLALGRKVLQDGDAAAARGYFEEAMQAPDNLGEARHLLANASDIHFWLGEAEAALGNRTTARKHWAAAARSVGDFQQMSVRAHSEMTYYSALALERLGRPAAARRMLRALLAYARELARTPAKIDYFATSLPTMLVFDEDLTERQRITATFLQAQAQAGLGQVTAAKKLLAAVLRLDPNHALAADLLGSPPLIPDKPAP
jgi:tetratricopeptide (TPR) repeat protein